MSNHDKSLGRIAELASKVAAVPHSAPVKALGGAEPPVPHPAPHKALQGAEPPVPHPTPHPAPQKAAKSPARKT